MLLKYALKQNWEVINVYSDDDYSGNQVKSRNYKVNSKDIYGYGLV